MGIITTKDVNNTDYLAQYLIYLRIMVYYIQDIESCKICAFQFEKRIAGNL